MSVIQFKTDSDQDVTFYLPSKGKTRFLIEEAFHNISEDFEGGYDTALTEQITDLLNLLEIFFVPKPIEEAVIDNI